MPRSPTSWCLPFVLPAALHAQQTERYTFDSDPVAVYNLVGSLRVEPGNDAVTVQVTRAGAEAGRLKIVQGELDGRSTLRVVYPGDRIRFGAGGESTQLQVRDDGTFGDLNDEHVRGRHGHDRRSRWDPNEGRRVTIAAAGGIDARADLAVQVPRGRRVELFLAVGSVSVTNVDGEVFVDAHSAPVTATGTKGILSVDVGSGGVKVTQADGELSVDTGSGDVEVSRFHGQSLSVDTGSGDVTGSQLESEEVSIDTGSGEIRLTGVASPTLSLETGSGGVTADLRQDIASLRAETGSGDIAIHAPASLGAEVEIETSSGDIETDFPLQVTRHGRDHMVGTIGDGKGTIAIETGSGEVRLLKNPN
jgi:lia operon protein LiaG